MENKKQHQVFFVQVETAWKTFTKNLKLITLLMFVDFLFYYLLIRIQMGLFVKAGEHVKAVSSIIQEQVQQLSESELIQLNSFLMKNPEFVMHYNQIIKYIALFFLALLLMWIVLKGINWFLTHKMLGKKAGAAEFALKFVLLSLLWFVIYLAVIILLARFWSSATSTLFPVIRPEASTAISLIIILIITYFSLISFSLILEKGILNILKRCFSLGFKKIKKIMPAYLLVLLFLFVTATLPITLFKLNYFLSIAFILLITLPALTLSRIYFISVISKAAV